MFKVRIIDQAPAAFILGILAVKVKGDLEQRLHRGGSKLHLAQERGGIGIKCVLHAVHRLFAGGAPRLEHIGKRGVGRLHKALERRELYGQTRARPVPAEAKAAGELTYAGGSNGKALGIRGGDLLLGGHGFKKPVHLAAPIIGGALCP